MKLTLIIRTHPASASWQTALSIANSWVHRGHHIVQIFLQSDAVLACEQHQHALVDLLALNPDSALACVGSANKRGICNDSGDANQNWLSGIHPGSLGQLADAISQSNKVITLG